MGRDSSAGTRRKEAVRYCAQEGEGLKSVKFVGQAADRIYAVIGIFTQGFVPGLLPAVAELRLF